MPQVTMPDGAVVEMPDQLDPALGARLRAFQTGHAKVAEQAPPTEPIDTTLPAGATVRRNPNMNPSALPKSNATPGELAQAAASGVNSTVADVAGFPVDLLNSIRQLITGGGPGTPVGGSESLKNAARAISPSTVDTQPTQGGADLSGLHTAAGLVGPGELAKGANLGARGVEMLTDAAKGAAGTEGLPAVVEGANKPVVGTGMDAVQTARARGFKFTPGGVESRNPAAALNDEVPQSFAVTPNDRRAIDLHNQALSTEVAGEHIGLKGARNLSTKNFDDARLPHYATYKDTGAALGEGLKGSDDLLSTLQSRLADTTQTALKGPVVAQVQRIVNAASSGNLSGPQMVRDISWMRANGGRDVAKALETEMEGQLAATNNTQQLEKFRDARTSLAQIRNLQDASKGGQVDVSKLVQLDQKYPNLLTGNLKLLAQSGAASPQDFRLPSGVQPGSSPISKPTWAGIATNAVKKAAKTVAPGKFDVTSDAFQNKFGGVASPTEASYFKDLGKRPAPPSKAFELEAPQGAAGVPPRQGGMELPQGPEAAPKLDLAAPEGEVGVNPRQLGMEIAQGRPAAPRIDLAAPEGELGEPPSRQLGMQIAQGRPLEEQHLALKPTEGTIEPHQPSLLGHEGTPEGGSRKPKAKKRGKD